MPRLYEFADELRSNGRSLAMRRKVITNLKTVLTFAQSKGWVTQNVGRGVRLRVDTRNTESGPLRDGVGFPSRAELRTLMKVATGRWRPFLITAVFTGMRASELRGLNWSNVDLDRGVIHVRQRADAWGTIGKPKSKAGNRAFRWSRWSSIPCGNGGPPALQAHWNSYSPTGVAMLRTTQISSIAFGTPCRLPQGRPWTQAGKTRTASLS